MVKWRSALVIGLVVVAFGAVATSLFAAVVDALSVPVTSDDLLWTLGWGAFAAVGGLVAVRRPENPIGWMFLAAGLLGAVGDAAVGVARLRSGSTGGIGAVAGWLSTWIWAPALGAVIWSIVLFPTGRALGPLSSAVGRTAMGLTLLVAAVNAVDLWAIRSPEMAVLAEMPGRISDRTVTVVFPGVLLCAVAGMVALVVRFRRSDGVERQQMKWVAVVAAISGPAIVLGETLARTGAPNLVLNVLSAPAWLAVAAGLAVLRYRLYDIDRLITRTVSYAIVTAVLVGVYAGGVLGLGAIARALTGESGDLVVALSTLAVAALFAPVRARVQTVVDRRFNRARADAARMVADFGSRLRDEVDLPHLRGELEGLTRHALQPSLVALWLPGGTR